MPASKCPGRRSSLNTVSARAMLTALIETEINPLQLANLATGRMQKECSAGRVPAIIPVVQPESALQGLGHAGDSPPRRLSEQDAPPARHDRLIANAGQPVTRAVAALAADVIGD